MPIIKHLAPEVIETGSYLSLDGAPKSGFAAKAAILPNNFCGVKDFFPFVLTLIKQKSSRPPVPNEDFFVV